VSARRASASEGALWGPLTMSGRSRVSPDRLKLELWMTPDLQLLQATAIAYSRGEEIAVHTGLPSNPSPCYEKLMGQLMPLQLPLDV
jgi:hypothetical protein